MAAASPGEPTYERAYEELLSLYDGPMRLKPRARVLRALRARADA